MTNNPTTIELAKKLLELYAHEELCLEGAALYNAQDFALEYSPALARALIDTHDELTEEARINGAGGERELALLARAERAENALREIMASDNCHEAWYQQIAREALYDPLSKPSSDKE